MEDVVKKGIQKSIENGKNLNLRMDTWGAVYLTLQILNEEKNILKEIEFLIDTGFDGYLQLQRKDVSDLELVMDSTSKAVIANGTAEEVGIVKTKIKILDQIISGFPIQVTENGLYALGTRLLKDTKRMLIIDYSNSSVTITDDKEIQAKVDKATIN